MEFKRCLAFTAVIAAFAACQIIETDVIDQGRIFDKTISFSVSDFEINDPFETRTSIQSGNKFIWTANDTVGIFPNTGSQVFFEMTSGAGANTATFDGGGWDFKPSAVYRSYYPLVGEFYLDQTNIPVSYEGQRQVGNDNTERIGPYDFMYTPATSAEDGILNFSYKHLSTILKTKITLPAGHYTRVALMAEEPVFVMKGHYDLTATPPTIICDTRSKFLSANLDIDLPSDTQLVAYILSAPINLSGKTLTVIATDDQGNSYSGLKTIPANYPFLAQNIYSLNYSSVNSSPALNEIRYKTIEASSSDAVVSFDPTVYKLTEETGNEIDFANCVAPENNGGVGILRFKAPVTEIDEYAFSNTNIKEIILPDCVETIHQGAFSSCQFLSDATLGSGLKSIGSFSFHETSLTSITLPEGLDRIGAFAFEGTLLESVNIPESVSHLGFREDAPYSLAPLGNPFNNCPNLRRFEGKFATQDGRALVEFLPDNGNKFFVSFATKGMDGQAYHVPEVYGVSPYAFAYSTIGSVTFSDNLKTIYVAAFWNCEQLKSVEMPSSLERIGGYAFYHSRALEFIEINSPQLLIAYDNQGHMFDGSSCPIYVPSGLVDAYKTTALWSDYAERYHYKQPEYAIWYTTTDNQIASITLPTGYSNQYSDGIGVLKSQNHITEIPEHLFQNCHTLKSVSIPDQVTKINGFAFDGCENLESVQFGASVTFVDSWSFRNCNLGTLVLPETVTYISDNAFEGNPFTTVRIPANTVIETNVFANCANLESFTGDNSMIADEGRCLISDGKLLSFAPASTAGLYTIPEGVTAISYECFRKAKFSELRIPASVTEIGSYSIMDCPNLTKITIESLILPELIGVSSVERLFYNLPSNYEIWIPGAGVATVGSSGDSGWALFDDHFVVYQTDSELWFHKIDNSFDDLYLVGDYTGDGDYDGWSQTTLYLNTIKGIEPQSILPASISDDLTYIKVFYLTSGESITKMADYGFSDEHPATMGLNQAQKIDWVSLPNTVTEIGQKAFKGCSNLLLNPLADWRGDNLTTIGDEAFNGCSNMVWQVQPYLEGHIDYYTKISSIGRMAFKNCSSLNWALGFDSGPSIGQDAFEGSSLPAVYFYQASPSIEQGAFKNCTSLTKASLFGVTEVKDSTFTGCMNLKTVTFAVVDGHEQFIKSFGKEAFCGCSSLSRLGSIDSDGVSEVYSLETIDCQSLALTGLTKLRLPNLKTSKGTIPFYHSPLTLLELPSFETPGSNTFLYIDTLKELNLPSVRFLSGAQLSRVTKLWLGPNFNGFSNAQLYYTTEPLAISIYLSKESVARVFQDTFKCGSTEQLITVEAVYVPANLVDAYKADSAWQEALATANATVEVIQAMPTD